MSSRKTSSPSKAYRSTAKACPFCERVFGSRTIDYHMNTCTSRTIQPSGGTKMSLTQSREVIKSAALRSSQDSRIEKIKAESISARRSPASTAAEEKSPALKASSNRSPISRNGPQRTPPQPPATTSARSPNNRRHPKDRSPLKTHKQPIEPTAAAKEVEVLYQSRNEPSSRLEQAKISAKKFSFGPSSPPGKGDPATSSSLQELKLISADHKDQANGSIHVPKDAELRDEPSSLLLDYSQGVSKPGYSQCKNCGRQFKQNRLRSHTLFCKGKRKSLRSSFVKTEAKQPGQPSNDPRDELDMHPNSLPSPIEAPRHPKTNELLFKDTFLSSIEEATVNHAEKDLEEFKAEEPGRDLCRTSPLSTPRQTARKSPDGASKKPDGKKESDLQALSREISRLQHHFNSVQEPPSTFIGSFNRKKNNSNKMSVDHGSGAEDRTLPPRMQSPTFPENPDHERQQRISRGGRPIKPRQTLSTDPPIYQDGNSSEGHSSDVQPIQNIQQSYLDDEEPQQRQANPDYVETFEIEMIPHNRPNLENTDRALDQVSENTQDLSLTIQQAKYVQKQDSASIPQFAKGPQVMKQCPFCKRKFREDAAKRHMPICQSILSRPKPPPSRVDIIETQIKRKNALEEKKNQFQKSISVEVLYSQKATRIGKGSNSLEKDDSRKISLNKLKQTKDTVAQLVGSNIIAELQKERESPFLRRESNRSMQSKSSMQSSPIRYVSPLQARVAGYPRYASQMRSGSESTGLLGIRNPRNSVNEVPRARLYESAGDNSMNSSILAKKVNTIIGRGTQMMACLKKGVAQKNDLGKNGVPLQLAEIKEKREKSEKKKEFAQSDVKTRYSLFSYIQCPICLRKFGERAAEPHIRYCTEKAKLMGNKSKLQGGIQTYRSAAGSQMALEKMQEQKHGSGGLKKNYSTNLTPQRKKKIDMSQIQSRIDTGIHRPSSPLIKKQWLEKGISKATLRIDQGSELYYRTHQEPKKPFETYRQQQQLSRQHSQQQQQAGKWKRPITAHSKSFKEDEKVGGLSASKKAVILKFCTHCGSKFVSQTHRFCGDCGRPRGEFV